MSGLGKFVPDTQKKASHTVADISYKDMLSMLQSKGTQSEEFSSLEDMWKGSFEKWFPQVSNRFFLQLETVGGISWT